MTLVKAARWFSSVLVAASAVASAATPDDQSVSLGHHQFESSCAMCHAVEKSKGNIVGPNLAGVVGRKIGKLSGFQYSAALKDSKGAWDEASLDAFLKNPQAAQPGTAMPFAGIRNDEDRRALITYLKTAR
ncbi:Cytochrome c2 iso-2 [Caballeronia hypogeia]|uniref:Cytochrome c2 iso-2 n=1 Tax=Caballeronia hypogeia TaxID=1777140 RepID=A0A158BWR7_9BURK|nr:c-type cytochrome [Caballeronia hypogeia]SAK74554.1 Cytochrome c2 iso-2 [Caballeronia hypogeia]